MGNIPFEEMFQLGDKVVAIRDACFTWNENVKAGEVFVLSTEDDLRYLRLLGDRVHEFYRRMTFSPYQVKDES